MIVLVINNIKISIFYTYVTSQTFRNVFVDGDPTALHAIAKALMKLQCLYGLIQTLKVYGVMNG